jgi:uncharacterized protein (DUF58 family)
VARQNAPQPASANRLRPGEQSFPPIDPLDWRQMLVAVRKLADSFSYGTDRSPFLGAGVEYVQSRRYEFGDPVRSIDWRVTARTGKHYVKQFETPRQVACQIVLDTSASMVVSSRPRSKLATAIHIAGGVALACLERVSPVGLATTGAPGLDISASLSRDQVFQWLLRLRRYRLDGRTLLGQKLAEQMTRLPNRALVVVLSDLHDPSSLPALRSVAQRHDCLVVRMEDPAEAGVRGGGLVRMLEPETGRERVAPARTPLADMTVLDQDLKRSGIDLFVVNTGQTFEHRLRWFLKSRGGLGRGTR